MDAYLAAALGLVSLGASVLLGLTFSPVFMTNRTQAFSESVGIKLVPELQNAVQRRLALRYRGIAIGAEAGVIAGAFIVKSYPATVEPFLAALVFAGVIFTGPALGAAISSLFSRPHRDPDAMQYARARTVTLEDYVPPLESWPARIGVVLSLIAVVIALLAGVDVRLPAILAALGAVSLGFFEIVGRRIVARPQPAASPRELGWDDALRASVLRDMVTAPLVLGLYSLLLTLVAIFGSVQPTSLLFIIATLVISRLSARTRPQRHFLRRLWDAPPA